MHGEKIRITGTVQGVGFRPFVWRLARECKITGNVCNDSQGVLIEAWGEAGSLREFAVRLRHEAPPLARIETIVHTALDDVHEIAVGFQITGSHKGEVQTAIAADAATCPDCLAETLNPDDRRFRYPFTNCTHCGPRLSIINAIPYDRANTSMKAFTMCGQCQAEYEDPADRRFHAQPNACPVCGPQIWLEDGNGQLLEAMPNSDLIETAAQLIAQGSILAIKGLGGFHLACDAGNEEAVMRLRQRKHRYRKALALMACNIEMVQRYARVTDQEAALLRDKAAPIVVLNAQGERVAASIAPGQTNIGFMLPYTPLHHLLMQSMPRPIVMTSGNRSDEPQSIDNTEAHQRLGQIADYYLLHDREIVNRLDDSVLQISAGQPRLLRRARGYAPESIRLPQGFNTRSHILAMGGELKNTFCLLKEGRAILSPHIGDLQEAASQHDYRHLLGLYRQLFGFQPQRVVVDKHPGYLSTTLGYDLAEREAIPSVAVQHHHAHIAACMADNQRPLDAEKVLGIALDGLGYGDDGTLWGGEFLLADYTEYQRLAHFQPFPLLGGTQAIHEPWRNTLSQLQTAWDWQRIEAEFGSLDIIRFLNTKPLENIKRMVDQNLNTPMTSSCGRLFDAVAAAIGVCRERVSHEGEAAQALESLATPHFQREAPHRYPYKFSNGENRVLCWQPLWQALLKDLQQGQSAATISARFHQGVAHAIAESAQKLCIQNSLNTVVLSGGVFQNRLLLESITERLEVAGIQVLSPINIPANDGGIAFGQVVIAAAKLIASATKPR